MGYYDDLISKNDAPAGDSTSGGYYDRLISDEDEQRSVLEANLNLSSFADPGMSAQKNALAGKLKTYLNEDWAPSVVDPVEAQRRLRVVENDHLLRNSPALSRRYLDTGFAERTSDDLAGLAKVESSARTFLGTLGDVAVVGAKGSIGLPQAFVGLLDIPTFGYVGKGLDAAGIRFNEAQKILDGMYSPAQQKANAAVQDADGFVDTLSEALQNPSVIATTVGESLPQILGGAAIARKLLGYGASTLAAGVAGPQLPGMVARLVGERLAPLIAGAAGEGLLAAGSAAEGIRGKTDDELLTLTQSASALMSGIGTAVFGVMGGKVAQRFGITDLDTALAQGGINRATAETLEKGFVRRMVEGGLSEGFFEELPQSAQEQMWQNFALERPIMEGVGNAAAMGLLAGAATGGVFSAFSGNGSAPTQFERDLQSVQGSLKAEQLLNEFIQNAAQTQTLQRSQQDVADLINEVDEEGQSEVFINARQFATVFNQSPVETAQRLGVTPEQLNAALASNGDIVVPVTNYATVLAQDPALATIVEHTKVAPGAMTPAEARHWQSTQGEQFQAEAEQVMAKRQADEQYQTEVQSVHDAVLGELNAARRFTPQVNERYAAMTRDFYVAMADRAGMSVGDFAARYPLRVVAQGTGPLAQGAAERILVENDRLILDGNDVGMAEIRAARSGNGIEVARLYIDPEHQRQGVGGALIDKLLADNPSAEFIDVYPGSPSEPFWIRQGVASVDGENYFRITRDSRAARKNPTRTLSQTAVSPAPTSGPFGPIFTEFYHDAHGAIAKLTELQSGEAVAALHHPEIGDIDLVWGKEGDPTNDYKDGHGVAKLLVKHPEALNDLQGFLLNLPKDAAKSGANRIVLENDQGRAIVSLNHMGGRKVWLLTAFEKKQAGEGTLIDTADVIRADDTASRATSLEQSIEQDVNKFYQSGRDAATIIADAAMHKAAGNEAKALQFIDQRRIDLEGGKQFLMPGAYESQLAELQEAARRIRDGAVAQVTPVTGQSFTPADWSPDVALIAKVKQVFGITHNALEAGYVLPDGTMLDFSGRHYSSRDHWPTLRGQRSVDHRELHSENVNGQTLTDLLQSSGSEGMYEFMARTGAMRIDASSGVASLARPPTPKQITALGNARKGEYVALSYNRPDGQIIRDGEMDSASPIKIRKFFDEALNSSGQGGAYAQASGNNRGSFNPDTNTIALLENADLSTFLHESGHFYLEVMSDMASRPDAAPQIRKDFETALAWFGIQGTPEADPVMTWNLMSLEEKRPFHEQWARGVEVYLAEGKAPSVEMQGLFQRFRAWMLNVYKSLDALNVTLTDDVRSVFDRMLASDEAIKTAEVTRNFAPIFQTAEQAGMTAEAWAEYQADTGQATADAVDALQTRSIRDLRWFADAKARKIKELQATAKEVRNQVMMDVRREVLSQPIYRAWQFLTGKNPDKIIKAAKSDPSQIDPTKDTLLVAIAKLGGMDREQAIKEWGLDPKDDTKADNPGGKQLVTRKGGMPIDDIGMALAEWGYLPENEDGEYDQSTFEELFFDALRGGEYYSAWGEAALIAAEERKTQRDPENGITLENTPAGKLNTGTLKAMYGEADTAPWRLLSALRMTSPEGFQPDMVANIFEFSSGDELVRRLAVAEDPKIVIEGMTDQRMLEQYGDLATPADMERAAEVAIHNDLRARVLTRELNALRQATGKAPILFKAARQHAETWLARQTVKNATRPAPHTAAEARSGKAAMDALAKGDTASAAQHKRDQLLNNQLARAALRAQSEVDSAVAYLKKFAKAGTRKAIDPSYTDQIDALLERFDLRQVGPKELKKRASLRAWLDDQEALGLDPVVDARLVEDAQRQHYSTLTLEEFRGLVDTVKSIEHMGRLKTRLLTAKDKRAFAEVVVELSESIADNANRTTIDKNPITATDKVQRALIELGAHHRKFASFVREMDGGKDGGPMWEYLLRAMNAAGDKEASMRADLSQKLADLFQGIKKVKLNDKVFVPELNISLRREEILAIALNAGNEGSVQRLLDGGINNSLRAVSADQLKGVLNRLSSQEWDFVEGVWRMIEANRPLIAAQEKALTGVEPTWIEPSPFTLANGRVISGGYYPAKYNGLFSTRSAELEAITDTRQQMKGAAGRSSTRNGYTKQRAEEVTGRPLKLDLNVIAQHINEVTHRLAWQEWLIDARRILKAPAIESAIKEHYGVAVLNEMKQHLQDIADGDQAAQDAWGKIANHVRTGTTIVGMGWNIMTALAQPVGITQSIERVGAKWIGKGMKTFVANPLKATANVQQVSPFMHSRALTMNREINDVLNRVRSEKMSAIEGSYFSLIQKFQQMVDVPTWLGAYEKAVAEGNADVRAIALADQAVLDSQGGGQIKDLAGMQKGNEYKKLFTNFYSFFNVLHQRMAENHRATDYKDPLSVGKAANNYLLLFVLPTVWMMAIKDALRGGDDDDDDDDDELLAKYAKEQLSYIMGTTIMGRELASAMSDFDYRGPTGLRFFVEFGKLYKQSMQGEIDMPWFKAAMNTAGTLLHFPSGQITRMIEGANAFLDDEAGPQAVLVGPPLRN